LACVGGTINNTGVAGVSECPGFELHILANTDMWLLVTRLPRLARSRGWLWLAYSSLRSSHRQSALRANHHRNS
jgi:hypothetical protein